MCGKGGVAGSDEVEKQRETHGLVEGMEDVKARISDNRFPDL